MTNLGIKGDEFFRNRVLEEPARFTPLYRKRREIEKIQGDEIGKKEISLMETKPPEDFNNGWRQRLLAQKSGFVDVSKRGPQALP